MGKSILTAVILASLATASVAGPFAVDGNLADWGVNVADGNASNITGYIPVAGVLGWMSEDQNDNSNSGYLGPNSGGQNYDAEWMGVAHDGATLYIALVTGQRPDNEFKYFAPGDIRLEIAGTTYGIEVGGGAGTGKAGFTPIVGALEEYGEGSTYTLNGSGHTTGYNGYMMPDEQTAGSLWQNPEWILDPITPKGEVQVDHQFVGGNVYLGHVSEYHYTLGTVTSQHAIIELSLDMAALGIVQGDMFSVHWRPGCGNDELNVFATVHTPEPATALLLVLGSVVLAGGAIRRRRRQA